VSRQLHAIDNRGKGRRRVAHDETHARLRLLHVVRSPVARGVQRKDHRHLRGGVVVRRHEHLLAVSHADDENRLVDEAGERGRRAVSDAGGADLAAGVARAARAAGTWRSEVGLGGGG